MGTALTHGIDLQLIVPSAFAFVAVVACVLGVVSLIKTQANQRIRDRLHDVVADKNDEGINNIILRDMELSAIPLVNRLLGGAKWARRLDTLLLQADIKMRVGTFVVLVLVLGCGSALLVDMVLARPFLAIGVGLILSNVPLLYVKHKKRARTLKFEEQFPDALDMLTPVFRHRSTCCSKRWNGPSHS